MEIVWIIVIGFIMYKILSKKPNLVANIPMRNFSKKLGGKSGGIISKSLGVLGLAGGFYMLSQN